MSSRPTTYYVSRDPDGTVSHLVRFRYTDEGLHSEYFRMGQWHESGSVMDYLFDPLLGDKISEAEALRIEREILGRTSQSRGADPPGM